MMGGEQGSHRHHGIILCVTGAYCPAHAYEDEPAVKELDGYHYSKCWQNKQKHPLARSQFPVSAPRGDLHILQPTPESRAGDVFKLLLMTRVLPCGLALALAYRRLPSSRLGS
ncbi:hypothetical protein H920_12756 [Fukomys damarensis]|uniref:Uncharacterized protein n=1 Tax=Fukomys damarensis TaxID=885580 RepID=A0A091D5T2_FUKDA|nr:hypothetical protein H920_12756 [Fukomys damarensis]